MITDIKGILEGLGTYSRLDKILEKFNHALNNAKQVL